MNWCFISWKINSQDSKIDNHINYDSYIIIWIDMKRTILPLKIFLSWKFFSFISFFHCLETIWWHEQRFVLNAQWTALHSYQNGNSNSNLNAYQNEAWDVHLIPYIFKIPTEDSDYLIKLCFVTIHISIRLRKFSFKQQMVNHYKKHFNEETY